MVTRQQVDELVAAIKARDIARAKLYGDSPSDMPIQEYVYGLDKLHEIATALNTSTYEMTDYVSIEAVDYNGVHFYAPNGKVK